jgi:hypothetical protein
MILPLPCNKTLCCLNYLSYSENNTQGASPQMQQSHELQNREKWRKLPAIRGAWPIIFYLVMWKLRTNRTRYFITLLKNPLVEMVLSRDEKNASFELSYWSICRLTNSPPIIHYRGVT